MKAGQTEPITLTDLDVQLETDELVTRLSQGIQRPQFRDIAETTLTEVNGIWRPSISYRWLNCSRIEEAGGTHRVHGGDENVILDLGVSSHFLNNAEYVLVAIFTIGEALEAVSRQTSKDGQVLIAYIIDVIGLIVLEKTGDLINSVAEDKARELGWGVSPLLSPGSIHGWNLEEQLQLCSLLPIAELGLKIQNDAVLKPFKSMTSLIGIGPGYSSAMTGAACLACSKNDECHFKNI